MSGRDVTVDVSQHFLRSIISGKKRKVLLDVHEGTRRFFIHLLSLPILYLT